MDGWGQCYCTGHFRSEGDAHLFCGLLALSIAYHISYSRDFDLRTHHTPSRCHKSTIQGRAGGTHTSGPALVATNESATEAGTGVGLETDLLLGLTTSLRSVTRLGPPYIKDSLSRLRITFAFDSLLELETLCCSATTEILRPSSSLAQQERTGQT